MTPSEETYKQIVAELAEALDKLQYACREYDSAEGGVEHYLETELIRGRAALQRYEEITKGEIS